MDAMEEEAQFKGTPKTAALKLASRGLAGGQPGVLNPAFRPAVVSVRFMVSWLSRRGLGVFGWWRLIAAAGVGELLLTGRL